MLTITDRKLLFKKIIPATLALILVSVPLLENFIRPDLKFSYDYIANFYPAGKLILEGKPSILYTPTASFIESSFNDFAHKLLPNLSHNTISAYMYSPLTALLFAPFSLLSLDVSFFCWQIASIIAYALSFLIVRKTAPSTKIDFLHELFYGLLYFPILHTLAIGQLGIIAGLLPLSLGYFFLVRNRYFFAGLTWSLLLLKPQFLLAAILITIALLLNKKYLCILGLILGTLLSVGLCALLFDPTVFIQWLKSFKVAESMFANPNYSYATYLVTSLPAVLLHFFPVNSRYLVKIPAYLLGALICIHALWFNYKRIKIAGDTPNTLCSTSMIALVVLPLALPHFCFYDFCIYALFMPLSYSEIWSKQQQRQLIQFSWTYIFIFSAYAIWSFVSPASVFQPALLVLAVALSYCRLLSIFKV